MVEQKKHRNALYSLVILLALFQIIFFIVISMQVSKLSVQLNSEITQTDKDFAKASEETNKLIAEYNVIYSTSFNELSNSISAQKEDFNQEIKLLKSSQDDFSGIIQDAVKSVVTVATPNSLGSGFVIGDGTYVVTNYHVIENNLEEITVRTYQRDLLIAELLGFDEERDVALLKIADNYPVLELADSDKLQPGNKVIAIGNPLGLSFTVTDGIVSAVHREGPNGLEEYIQIDVSLNLGNSGGPLLNTAGEVVGINNFKIGNAESLGFALEINPTKSLINKFAGKTII